MPVHRSLRLAIGVGMVVLACGAGPLTGKPGVRVDRLGDALPPGAIFRIGTHRLQLDRQLQAIAASPDGKLVAAVSDDSLGVWEVPSGREILRRPCGSGGFLAFSPDSKLLAFKGTEWLVLFDFAKGQLRPPLTNHQVTGCFAPDGKMKAVMTSAMVVVEFDAASSKPLNARELLLPDDHGQSRVSIAISRDGKTIATLATQRNPAKQFVWLHDFFTGKIVRSWEVDNTRLRNIIFSPDSRLLAATGSDAEARIWDVATGNERARWKTNGGVGIGASGFAFAPDGDSVLCTQSSGVARWDWRTGKLVQEFPDVGGPIAFAAGGKILAVQGSLGSIRLLDFATGKDVCPLPRADKHVALSADGRLVAWAEGNAIVLAETRTGSEVRRWPAHVRYVGPLAFAPDGKTLASAGTDRRIRLWDVGTGKQTVSMIKNGVDTLFFSPDSQRLISAGFGETCLWDAATGNRQGSWTAKDSAMAPDFRTVAVAKAGVIHLADPVTRKLFHELPDYLASVRSEQISLAVFLRKNMQLEYPPTFSGNGRLLTAGGAAGPSTAIFLWDVDTGKKLPLVLSPNEFVPQNLTISPDNRLLAALRFDRKMCLLSTTTGNVARVLGEADDYPWPTPAFTPDGRTLITATKGAVQFWEIATGGEIARRPAHRDDVRELIVSANGRRLATTSWDHAILIWDLARLVADDRPRGAGVAEAELPALWADLASPDAKKGRNAVETLIAAPKQAVKLLRDRLKPAPIPDVKKVAAWIADLGSDDFDKRQQAEHELDRLGESAGPLLQKAVAANPPLEARRRIEALLKKLNSVDLSAEALRGVRAVQVLETIGSPEARLLLQELGRGAAGARLTVEAAAARKRLVR